MFKTFKQYVEDQAQNPQEEGIPDGKQRNGLADPDPGELKKPHNPNSKDVELAKQAIQIMMLRSAKWHKTLHKFLRRVGDKIPDVSHIVDQMTPPKDTSPQMGKKKEPDVFFPSMADTSPAFYQR